MIAFTPGFISCSREFNGNITTVAGNKSRKIHWLEPIFHLSFQHISITFERSLASIPLVLAVIMMELIGQSMKFLENISKFFLFRTPIGLEDVSKYPKLIEHLIEVDQWTDDEIIKLIGGNILRVLEENEKVWIEICHLIEFELEIGRIELNFIDDYVFCLDGKKTREWIADSWRIDSTWRFGQIEF